MELMAAISMEHPSLTIRTCLPFLVSAVPMAARVVQKIGSRADKKNYLLMFAMGPNIAGVIGTVIAAGIFLSILK